MSLTQVRYGTHQHVGTCLSCTPLSHDGALAVVRSKPIMASYWYKISYVHCQDVRICNILCSGLHRCTHVHGAGAVGFVGEGQLDVIDVSPYRGGVGGRHHVILGRQVLPGAWKGV